MFGKQIASIPVRAKVKWYKIAAQKKKMKGKWVKNEIKIN